MKKHKVKTSMLMGVLSDIEQNYVDSIHGATYLQVLDESIINLYQNK